MNKVELDGVEGRAEPNNRFFELVEMLRGIGAMALMAYFFYIKGYGFLIKQIWSSFFG